jgi:hypothetical protein
MSVPTRVAHGVRARSNASGCAAPGYHYSPCNGAPPPPFQDAPAAYAVDVRDDGVYVALAPEPERHRTVSDVLVETMTNWGVRAVFGMVGHSNLGFADALRVAEKRGDLRYVPSVTRAQRPSRSVRTASSPVRRRPASRSPGAEPPTCSPVSTTHGSTARRPWRSRDRCRQGSRGAGRSRTSTSIGRSPMSPATARPSRPGPTTPS